MNERGLPAGWEMKTMGEVAQIVGGSTPKTSEPSYWGGEIPWITPNDLSKHTEKYIVRGERGITKAGYGSCSTRMLPAGTVLLSTRAPIGYVAIARNPVCTNQGFKSFICGPGVDPEYAYWYLKGAKQLAESYASGTTFLELSAKAAARLPIPVPPPPEQRTIVEEIEKHWTRLDAAIAALKRAQANLKRYRAAVLQAAVTGWLVPTEAELARRGGRRHEPAGELLARVLRARQEAWEQKPGKTSTYKTPSPPATPEPPDLPPGWCLASLEQLTSALRPICYGILMPRTREGARIPYVEVKDLQGSLIDVDRLNRTTESLARQYARSSLEPGDVLLAIRGSWERAAITPPELKGANISRDVARLAILPQVKGRYVRIYLESPLAQHHFRAVARGVAVRGLNIGSLRATPLPLPPASEQERIVAETERQLSLIDEMEHEVEIDLRRAEAMRQAILARAFSGELLGGGTEV